MAASRSSVTDLEEHLPKKVGGKYRPLRVLGRGGMGVVYEVEHELTRDRLALKVLKRGTSLNRVALARFRREARMSSLIKSDHIVRVVDADLAPELGGAPYLVMDLLKGADLAAVSGSAPQEPAQVVDWLRQAARALDAAHRCGIVHRDVKPENLFLIESHSGEALIKVLDFGIASVPAFEDMQDTNTGSLVGTPMFMAPEQASGGEVGAQADGWSVAMCAFRLLSGRNYWNAENATLLLAKIIYEQVLPPSVKGLNLGPAFDEWFLRSCARDPTERWGTVGVQVEAMAAALGRPVHALAIPERLDATPFPATYEVTPGELAASDLRSHSLGGTYSSTSPPTTFPLRRLGVAFALAVVAGVVLSTQRPAGSTRSGGDRRTSPDQVSGAALIRARAPSATTADHAQPPDGHAASKVEETSRRTAAIDPHTREPSRNSSSLKMPGRSLEKKRAPPPPANGEPLPVSSAEPGARVRESTATTPRAPDRTAPSPSQQPPPRDPLADPD